MISFDELLDKESKTFDALKLATIEVAYAKLALKRTRIVLAREEAEHKKYADAISAHFMGFVDFYLKAEDK